ncbi:MAG TPA: tetratricopeptide repeat protein [Membranihabitans sp.]|nr:tetratricopeptide repeat protein [Membranihabitans sp.]
MKRKNLSGHIFLQFKKYYPRVFYLFMVIVIITGCRSGDSQPPEEFHFDDSLSYYNNLINVDPANADAHLARARYYYNQHHFAAALKDVEVALEIDSMRLRGYILKSQVEMDYFRSLESLRTMQKAEKIWPNSLEVKENLAQTFLILKQYDQAAAKATEILSLNPSAARPHLFLGMIAKEKQDSTLAIKHLHQAVQNDADLLDAWIELARIQMFKNPTKAAPYFQSALDIAPDDLRIWHAYAMYWEHQDSLEQAKNAYAHIISQDSQYHEAYYNQALILMDQDSFLTALTLWNAFIELDPQFPRGYFYRGICSELTGNLTSALEDYLQAQKLDPRLPNIEEAIRTIENKLSN